MRGLLRSASAFFAKWRAIIDQEVEITVSPVDKNAYLLKSEANRLQLREAIAHIDAGTNLVEVPMDTLQ